MHNCFLYKFLLRYLGKMKKRGQKIMENILEVHQLSKHFGKKQALNNVDFTVGKGRIVGLIGPNGAGKTTIMKAILGLFSYEKGQIKIDNHPVSEASHQALAKVGALIEYPAIYPYLTGLDHLKLNATGDATTERIDQLVKQMKMESYINRKAKNYSLGMKQKLGIALALINQPELVILDEPMNGLDPQATKDLRHVIMSQAAAGTSFLISSHILSELEKLVSEVVIIDHGEVIKQATIANLNHQENDFIMLKTSDDAAARTSLAQVGITTAEAPGLVFNQTPSATLALVIKTLVKADIDIYDVVHQGEDLEASLLSILHNEKKEA